MKRILLAAVAVVAFSGAAACSSTPETPSNVTITGSFTVKCISNCDGYTDIAIGAQATLVDETGKVVSTTNLTASSEPITQATEGSSRYAFTFDSVPPAVRYGFHVGNQARGTIWENRDEAVSQGFQVVLGN